MTIQVSLDDTCTQALREEAAALGVTTEQLASDILRRHLQSRPLPDRPVISDATFCQALTASVTENDELLRRLAK